MEPVEPKEEDVSMIDAINTFGLIMGFVMIFAGIFHKLRQGIWADGFEWILYVFGMMMCIVSFVAMVFSK